MPAGAPYTLYLMKDACILGRVNFNGEGYRFLPNVSGRKASRKLHDSISDCIPLWAAKLSTALVDKAQLDAKLAERSNS